MAFLQNDVMQHDVRHRLEAFLNDVGTLYLSDERDISFHKMSRKTGTAEMTGDGD